MIQSRRRAGILGKAVLVVLAGAAASAATAQTSPADWSDIEGRIQYAYYTNDSRALNSVLTSLKPKGGEGEGESGDDAAMRHYFLALTHYRIAQVMVAVKKSQAKDAIGECGDEVDDDRRCAAQGADWGSTKPTKTVFAASRPTRSAPPARSRAAR